MKSLTEFKIQLDEVGQGGGITTVYSSDSKLVPDGSGDGYRKVRARRIKTGDKSPGSIGISAPDVGNDKEFNGEKSTGSTANRLKKYMQNLNKNISAVKTPQQSINLKQEEVELSEGNSEQPPPYMLVLKRTQIRQFQGGMNVAFYHSEKLNKFFSVPYGAGVSASVQAEETITEFNEQNLVSNIINVFNNLSEDNQIKMLELINGDSDSYNKVKNFVLNNTDESN